MFSRSHGAYPGIDVNVWHPDVKKSLAATKELLLVKWLSDYYDLPQDAIQPEFFDFLKIVAMGAKKYAMNNWLKIDGKNSDEKSMHDSMGRHWAKSLSGHHFDPESGEDHLLHLACRALMLYTRRKRLIIHPEDLK